jgi:hypothetical protein
VKNIKDFEVGYVEGEGWNANWFTDIWVGCVEEESWYYKLKYKYHRIEIGLCRVRVLKYKLSYWYQCELFRGRGLKYKFIYRYQTEFRREIGLIYKLIEIYQRFEIGFVEGKVWNINSVTFIRVDF